MTFCNWLANTWVWWLWWCWWWWRMKYDKIEVLIFWHWTEFEVFEYIWKFGLSWYLTPGGERQHCREVLNYTNSANTRLQLYNSPVHSTDSMMIKDIMWLVILDNLNKCVSQCFYDFPMSSTSLQQAFRIFETISNFSDIKVRSTIMTKWEGGKEWTSVKK